MDQAGLCVHARTCGSALALEHNGDLYSCDHYVEPDHLLGSIADGRPMLELVDSPQQQAFGDAKLDTLPRYCRECEVRFACNGGCPKDRFATTPDGEPGLHHLCAGYKAFFGHVDAPMRFMADRLRAGRDATALRDWYAAADAERGRNDPCTCGSGRTFKRCHGRPAAGPSDCEAARTIGAAVAPEPEPSGGQNSSGTCWQVSSGGGAAVADRLGSLTLRAGSGS
jgi:uncharacterized protein